MSILVEDGGILTSVQDGGRYGSEQYGVYPSGPMDERSFHIANLLVGNEEREACLEITISGPRLKFTEAAVIAVTGGNFQPTVNGSPCLMYQAVPVSAGDVLSIGFARTGCRAYLAVAGGFDLPLLMGSRATLLKYGVGGYKGRKLAAGDELRLRNSAAALDNMPSRRTAAENFGGGVHRVRVIMGPQEEAFTEEGIRTFLGSTYTVGQESDRMGYRLGGPKIAHKTDGNIISDGIVMGSVQVPTAGEPIVMMADHPTVGGYTKIATAASADLPLVGQCRPGDKIRFEAVSVEAAQELYLAERGKLDALRQKIATPVTYLRPRYYTVGVNNTVFSLKVEEYTRND